MKNSSKQVYIVSTALLLLFLAACTTTKNTFMHRGWHNMNARYNGYFYSRENNKEVVKRIEKEHKDDFTKLIPLFIYTDNESAKTYAAELDKTIKKSSTVIQRHAITHPKSKVEIANACRWIDENYMLIGKAHLYKRDMMSALEVFTYVAEKYPNPAAKYNGMLWMVRTNNEIGSLSLSEPMIDEIRNAEDLPRRKWLNKKKKVYKSFTREFTAVTADYHIKRQDYTPAIQSLTEAIKLTRKKPVKARYTYVLAQLYEKNGDNIKASEYYAKVPGLHPSYDMAFSAQMNRAKLYDAAMGDSKEMKKQLLKMAKDGKNKEYLDQIYYGLAQIVYKENDSKTALDYLDKSIQNSVSNNPQKALSFLKKADISFEQTNYTVAEANYDSAMALLPVDYPGYSDIETKKNSLNALVTNLNVIALEDSVRVLSKLSPRDREKAVEKMIARLEEEERRKEELRQRQLDNQALNAQNTLPVPGSQLSSTAAWYFYNDATVAYGKSEFVKKWGDRKLEDNWRRKDKEQTMVAVASDDQISLDTSATITNKPSAAVAPTSTGAVKDKDSYLKGIPTTPDDMLASDNRIIEAFYNIATIYKEQLMNNQKSVEALEELQKRYPDNKYKQTVYYQLYRTYLTMNNNSRADYYKNKILTEAPDSEYARLIKNPSYAKDVNASKSVIDRFYTEAYEAYMAGNYQETLNKCNYADTVYSKNYLMPQFDLLKALAIGHTQSVSAYEGALKRVIVKHRKSPVKDKAQEYLDALKKRQQPVVIDSLSLAKSVVDSVKIKFVIADTGFFYAMLLVENGKGDLEALKAKIEDINTQNIPGSNLIIATTGFNTAYQQIVIQKLIGKQSAMDYYKLLSQHPNMVQDIQSGAFRLFVISETNHALLLQNKNVDDYQVFFNQNFR